MLCKIGIKYSCRYVHSFLTVFHLFITVLKIHIKIYCKVDDGFILVVHIARVIY